jgi:hypothetical protein
MTKRKSMKLKLSPASELRKLQETVVSKKKKNLKSFVTKWLNTTASVEIDAAIDDNSDYATVPVPHEAWEWDNEDETGFFTEVQRQLAPLGYVVLKSHDDGGLHSICQISWAVKNPRYYEKQHSS